MSEKTLSRPLDRSEIDFRVGSVIKSGEKCYATILAYKDARVDMKLLDEVFGCLCWQTRYERDSKGVLQCGIGVYNPAIKDWVWKWSNGSESNAEAEKGEYSDAFKRAGFMWGIGRHLYDEGEIFIELKPEEYTVADNRAKATNKLKPNKWEWLIVDGEVRSAKDKNGIRFQKKVQIGSKQI